MRVYFTYSLHTYPLAYRVAFEGIGSTKSVYINRTYRRNIDYVSRVNAGCKSNYQNLFPYNVLAGRIGIRSAYLHKAKKKRKKGRKWRIERISVRGTPRFCCKSHRIRFRVTKRKKKILENCDEEKRQNELWN